MSSITQIGVSTFSDELLQYVKDQLKSGTLEWNDLIDTPDYVSQDGKFLKALSGGGTSTMEWSELPPAGLSWQVQETDVTVSDKIGLLADGGITITLQDDPLEGSVIAIADRNSDFADNPVIVKGGNKLVEGSQELIIDLRNAYLQLIFDGTQWEMVQVNHPFNIQEITEESFPAGFLNYNLSRIPANRSTLLVTVDGSVVPTSLYSVTGNVLGFGTATSAPVHVRHIGVPSAAAVSDTPVGAMLYFPNGEPIDGWLDCTGASIGRSVYPDLVDYLNKGTGEDIAFLPDARGNFIRVWDPRDGADTIGVVSIPTVLRDNKWGRWLDTTAVTSSGNIWDGNTSTVGKVKYAHGYVGYRFDAPVSTSAVTISTVDPIGSAHVPTSVVVKASHDGVTWVEVSALENGPFQNRTVSINVDTVDPYRFWAVFGTGGTPYPTDTEHYWGVASVIFSSSTLNRAIGGFQGQAVGPIDAHLGGADAGAGSVQSGIDATALTLGGQGTVSGGLETRPDNQAYVLRIKAFHYQSGSLSDSNVTQLRDEISRLSARVNDGTSYVGAVPPPNPTDNARWYDMTSGRTYIWFYDGDSYQWVDDSPQAVSSGRDSINAAEILAVGSATPRALNERFTDLKCVLDFGAVRNKADDSKRAFERAGLGPVYIPTGTYYVSGGDFTGNIYFSFGPVTITGLSTGITVKDLLA